ncbi:MAG TPA: flagellar hook-basal body complex protein FliE [Bryobacteraceae bacterium]|nr:flagellar hook-basal body complex protein FliE [Bryobacteraceae bacterium]
MTAPISLSNPIQAIDTIQIGGQQSAATGFQDILKSAIQQVETVSTAADQSVNTFLSGGKQELHSTILAVQNAELQFEMFMQARNKVVSAYEEIMRMQV